MILPEELYQRSIEIILTNQSPTGAYIASPNFPTYGYCWFRDGSFVAYAMDLSGNTASSKGFHNWAAAAINRNEAVVARAIEKTSRGESLTGVDVLHTRYTLEGLEALPDAVEGEWANFQLDGFGTWLWALGEHLRLQGFEHLRLQGLDASQIPEAWAKAAGLAADYLTALWRTPCFDCWEEFSDKIHPHTLAAIYGGLKAHGSFSAGIYARNHEPTLWAIQDFLTEQAVFEGRFVKSIGSQSVDASLLGLSTPYRVVEPDDPLMIATVAEIEKKLVRGQGVHRYPEDTYYGGGQWLLLAGWLGWYYAEAGKLNRAGALLAWMASQASEDGYLSEQTPVMVNDPAHLDPWRRRWGEIANPLLWSHAKYIILYQAMQKEARL